MLKNKGISRLGGLGGTTYKGLEGGFFYEGVDLTSATINGQNLAEAHFHVL
ncbi:9973_t:CDS:2, partial [Entrophospora sp. SA101]